MVSIVVLSGSSSAEEHEGDLYFECLAMVDGGGVVFSGINLDLSTGSSKSQNDTSDEELVLIIVEVLSEVEEFVVSMVGEIVAFSLELSESIACTFTDLFQNRKLNLKVKSYFQVRRFLIDCYFSR